MGIYHVSWTLHPCGHLPCCVALVSRCRDVRLIRLIRLMMCAPPSMNGISWNSAFLLEFRAFPLSKMGYTIYTASPVYPKHLIWKQPPEPLEWDVEWWWIMVTGSSSYHGAQTAPGWPLDGPWMFLCSYLVARRLRYLLVFFRDKFWGSAAAVASTAAESRVMQGSLLYHLFLQIKEQIPSCVGWGWSINIKVVATVIANYEQLRDGRTNPRPGGDEPMLADLGVEIIRVNASDTSNENKHKANAADSGTDQKQCCWWWRELL